MLITAATENRTTFSRIPLHFVIIGDEPGKQLLQIQLNATINPGLCSKCA
jgi:hypothetical protein